MGKAVKAAASVGTFGVSDLVQGKQLGSGLTDALSDLDPTKVRRADQTAVNAAIENQKQLQQNAQNLLTKQLGYTQTAQGVNNTSLDLLQAAAEGRAPSQAQGILQQGADQAIAAQMAAANAGNMANQIVRQRAAADQGANIAQQTANQAGMLRAQEMAAARSAFNQGAGQNLATNTAAQQNTLGSITGLGAQQAQTALGQAGADQARLSQSSAVGANMLGGLLNSVGGAAGSLLGKGMTGGAKAAVPSEYGAGGYSKGGMVEGKEIVKGDSKKNDIIPALLSAGEIVIPKSATKDFDSAHKFLKEIFDKHDLDSDSDIKNDEADTNYKKELFKKKKD